MVDIIMKQFACFLQAVKAWVNLIWWKQWIMSYQKITLKTQTHTKNHCKDSEKASIFLPGPFGESENNIDRTTIDSVLQIEPETKLIQMINLKLLQERGYRM